MNSWYKRLHPEIAAPYVKHGGRVFAGWGRGGGQGAVEAHGGSEGCLQAFGTKQKGRLAKGIVFVWRDSTNGISMFDVASDLNGTQIRRYAKVGDLGVWNKHERMAYS